MTISKNEKKGIIISIIYSVVMALLMTVLGYLYLGGSDLDFEAYPDVDGDSISMNMHFRAIQEEGLSGLFFNPRIGAPDAGSDLADATGVDIMLGLMIWTIDLIFHPSTSRLFYYVIIFTFVVIAWSMSYLLSKLNVHPAVNFVFSVLYSIAPYHMYRSIYHLAIANAFTVPMSILASLYIAGIIKLNGKKDIAGMIISAVCLGFGCAYYTFFGFMLFAVACLFRLINSGNLQELIKKLWPAYITVGSFLLTRIPATVLTLTQGKNSVAFSRSPIEQEYYGLKIIQMLLPSGFSPLNKITRFYDYYNNSGALITENDTSNLGLIASFGFVVLCLLFIYSFIKKDEKSKNEWLLLDYLSLSVLSLVLIGSIGGFGLIFNLLVTAQMRCYNRVSVVITCICLITIAYCIDILLKKNKIKGICVCAGVFLLGFWDQFTVLPQSEVAAIKNDVYKSFFSQVEESIGSEGFVYQLPYMDYPEAPQINNMKSYTQFNGYLFTDNMRWSYGGIKGRNTAALELNIDNGIGFDFIQGIRDAGASAVMIDVYGYKNKGSQILSFYNSLGVNSFVSGDARYYVFDLREVENSALYKEYIEAGDQYYFNFKGYPFVYEITRSSGDDLTNGELLNIANGIAAKDEESYHMLFDIIEDQIFEATDEEYVIWLYQNIMGREPDNEGKAMYLKRLKDGSSREDLFNFFISSDEFRKNRQLD